MIKPEQIPQFTGDLAQLEKDYGDLAKDAKNVRDTGADVHSQFQGLSAYYQAPEAEQLFATTKPVKDKADAFADDLEKVSGALSSYATEIRPLVAKLKELKTKAQTFVDSVKDDDEWEYDEDKVGEHNQLRDDITATVAAFWAAERTCHNKITALWGAPPVVAGDGSDRANQYGFSAEDMKNAKLPWGDPVEEKHHWYEVGHWVKSFVWDGLIVDGIWGTIKGLGTLVGFGGWEAMGQAWKGLAQLATGLALSSIPGVGTLFWALPDDKLPSWIRDSRTAMKETGKALVAWDQWGKNPARAAGAVTFNVLTTVFTGGAGGAVAGAGKAGAVARVLGTTAKAIDPMTYIAKGAGAGLSKIGDISAALKGVGNIEIPRLPENAITLPEGAVRLPEGTVRLPEGAAIPAGGIRIPEGGAVRLPEGTPLPAGAVDLGNGAVKLPEGAAVPPGAVELPEGAVKLPDDAPVLPEGTVKLPTEDGAPARYYDPEGNILDEGGNVIQKSDDGPGDVVDQPDVPPAGADVPRVDSPVREPAMAGAAAHTADQAGQHIRLGNSLDDLGDVGRVGDDIPTTPAVHAGGDIPGLHAGNHLPGGTADNLPGGGVGGNMPTNSVDPHTPAGTTGNQIPGTGAGDNLPGGPANDLGTGGAGRDLPGGSGTLPGHTPEFPGGGAVDELGGVGDNTLDTAGGLGDDAATPGHQADESTGPGSRDGERELSVEERKRIQEEHVWKANNDPEWFEKHYDEIGRRKGAERIVDGVHLPMLTKDAHGNWIAKHNLPNGPSAIKFNPTPLGPETAPENSLPHLNEAARNRRLSVDLLNAERAFDENPSAANADALAKAKAAYDQHLPGVPNNSKLSEQLGEAAARHHVIPREFPGAERMELPKTPNGANMFDDVYKLNEDGHYLIVEEKAPSNDLDWRQGKADPDPTNPTAHDGGAQGMRVKQGTKPYIRTILAEMTNRGGRDADIAADLRVALREGKVQYVLVKAVDNTGHSYAGAVMEHLKI